MRFLRRIYCRVRGHEWCDVDPATGEPYHPRTLCHRCGAWSE